jgi:hypothetical protein
MYAHQIFNVPQQIWINSFLDAFPMLEAKNVDIGWNSWKERKINSDEGKTHKHISKPEVFPGMNFFSLTGFPSVGRKKNKSNVQKYSSTSGRLLGARQNRLSEKKR